MHSNVYMYEYIYAIFILVNRSCGQGEYILYKKKSTAYSIHEFDSLINDH